MSKRLQVLLDEAEMRTIQRLARLRGVTVAAWVRGALREAAREEPLTQPDRKLAVLRAAVVHEFPTADIDQMLGEIASGYGVE